MATINIEQLNKRARILDKLNDLLVVDENNCWLFRGKRGKYGCLRVTTSANDAPIHTHRFSYETYKGLIPQGYHIDHLCCEKSCCNPDHLEAVTAKENTIRAWKKGLCAPVPIERSAAWLARGREVAANKRRAMTHCKRGHEFNDENTYRKGNWRTCRACLRLGHHRRRKLVP